MDGCGVRDNFGCLVQKLSSRLRQSRSGARICDEFVRTPGVMGRGTLRAGSVDDWLVMRRACSALVLALVSVAAFAASQKQPITIKEWPVPWPDSQPTDPFVAGPEAVWFVGTKGHYLATLNPKTGAFKRIDLIDEPGPQSVIVAAN